MNVEALRLTLVVLSVLEKTGRREYLVDVCNKGVDLSAESGECKAGYGDKSQKQER